MRHQIDTTRFAISTEETRYYLNGIYFHKSDSGELTAVATDGHRLALAQMSMPQGADALPNIILPRKAVGELRKLLDNEDGEVNAKLSETRAEFSFGQVRLTSKLIDGSFPDYTRVIPQGNDKVLSVDRGLFSAAVDRVSTISSEKFRTVKLQIQNNKCTVSSFGEEKSAGTEEIDVIYDGKDININFNARYLLEVLSIITSEKIKICFADNTAPTVLKGDTEDNNSLYLIMQMRA